MQDNEQIIKISELIEQINSDILGHKDEIAKLISLIKELNSSISEATPIANIENKDINILDEVIEELKKLELKLRASDLIEDANLIKTFVDRKDEEIEKTEQQADNKSLEELNEEHVPDEELVESVTVEIDFSLLEGAETMFESWKFEEEVKATFGEFCKKFRDISSNVAEFRKEVELGMFKPGGSGNAGAFYEHLCIVVDILNDTVISDVPWVLMKQLASVLNFNYKAYDAAFRVTQALLSIKIAHPSLEVSEELEINNKQFLKNHHWQELDEKIADKDYVEASLVIERLMENEDSPEEHESLLKLKAQVVEKSAKIPWLFILISVFVASIVVAVALLKTGPSISGRVQTYSVAQSKTQPKINRYYTGQSGLKEECPPLQPTDTRLSLCQIRYVVFQKRRIEYLSKQQLSLDEQRLLKRMQIELTKRSKFYKFNKQDKDKVILELNKLDNEICSDATYMLKSWEKVYCIVGVVDPVEVKTKIPLLDISNIENVKRIQKRLLARGFYKGRASNKWDQKTKDALMHFKVMELKIVDSKWDAKTQKALLGKYIK